MPRLPRRRTETNDSVKNVKVPTEKDDACTGALEANTGIYRVTIPGRMPSLNEYIAAERRNRYIAAQMKSEKQYLAGLYIRKALPGIRIEQPVIIRYFWYEPNKRRDKSNVCGFGRKVIEDALVQQHVLKDDGWDEIVGFQDYFLIDKNNPRIEMEIMIWDITTSGAENITARAASASTAATTTTDTKATSDAAPGTVATAGTAKRRARTTSKKRKGR